MKKVLITGASRGIGRATALFLANHDYAVVGTSRDPSKYPTLEEGNVKYVAMNVNSIASVRKGVKNAAKIMGGIDVLINNAGISHVTPFEETSDKDSRTIMETNFFGLAAVTREAIPFLRESDKGIIINISSLGGVMGIPFQSYYVASKYAVEGLSESIRMELKSQGIQVVLIEPGNIRTEIGKHRLYPRKVGAHYQKTYSIVRDIVDSTVDEAESPEIIAKLILKILQRKNPRVRYPAGKGSGMISMLVRFLPQKITERLLLNYYNL